MTERPRFIDDLAGVAGGAFSALAGIREEAESMIRARVDEAIRKLDLVRRDDLDAVMEMAANARTGQEAAERRLAAPLHVIEQHLQQQQDAGQAHLAAARFTVADLCVASVLNWARPSRALMTAHPLTHDWILRCMARPAYVQLREFD